MTRLTPERLRQIACDVEALNEQQQFEILTSVLADAMEAADEIRGSVDRANRALDRAGARIAQLENELAAARTEAAFWRGLAAGASATESRYLQ